MSREKVTLRILRHEDIAITMDSGVSLFFGLRGKYTIATANEEYAIGASEIYACNPYFSATLLQNSLFASAQAITFAPESLWLMRSIWVRPMAPVPTNPIFNSCILLSSIDRSCFADGFGAAHGSGW